MKIIDFSNLEVGPSPAYKRLEEEKKKQKVVHSALDMYKLKLDVRRLVSFEIFKSIILKALNKVQDKNYCMKCGRFYSYNEAAIKLNMIEQRFRRASDKLYFEETLSSKTFRAGEIITKDSFIEKISSNIKRKPQFLSIILGLATLFLFDALTLFTLSFLYKIILMIFLERIFIIFAFQAEDICYKHDNINRVKRDKFLKTHKTFCLSHLRDEKPIISARFASKLLDIASEIVEKT